MDLLAGGIGLLIVTAGVTFVGFMFVFTHMPAHWVRRLAGYKGMVDVVVHASILYLFFGTSTIGLIQAELAGIGFSIYIRAYRWWHGYERLVQGRWTRFAGRFT